MLYPIHKEHRQSPLPLFDTFFPYIIGQHQHFIKYSTDSTHFFVLPYHAKNFSCPQILPTVVLLIKAAFDSVDRRPLWKALRGRGVQDILLNLIKALHHSTGARFRCGKNLSHRFWTTPGVRQGCVLAPALFCVVIDWILAHMVNKPGISVGNCQLTDLVYADDTALLVQSSTATATCLSSCSEAASTLGLRIS